MNKNFWLAALMLLATGLIAVGCGDDDEDEPTTDAPATEEEAPAIDTGSDEGDEAVAAAVESCKSSIQQVPNLSDDTISKLESICDDAASGDADAVSGATQEVCVAIVEDTVPEGPARDQATQACEATAAP